MDIDFEGTEQNQATGTGTQQANQPGISNNPDPTDLGGHGDVVDINKNNNNNNDNANNNGDNKNEGNPDDNGTDKGDANNANNSSTGELKAGDQVQYEDAIYTVSENGDLVDKDGKVFKQANEVNDWLASLQEDVDDNITLESIQDSFGQIIVGDDGKPVEFTNDAEGVKAYLKAVVDLQRNEIAEGAVNKLYADNPLLKQFQDYVQVTGSPVGFGELPDRSGITIDKDNTMQQETVIRMAAKEFGNMSLNDNYIKYLKDTGGLYDEAVSQLAALQEKDKQVREQIERQAEAQRAQDLEDFNAYWRNVNDVINSRTIAGYKLPESFVKEVNGKKQTLTPKDFYNYLSRQTEVGADGNKITAYQKDLENESDSDLLNRELLTAWLMYTGGTYKDLLDMAVKEEQVRVLKLKAKERNTKRTVKVVKPATSSKTDDILLG